MPPRMNDTIVPIIPHNTHVLAKLNSPACTIPIPVSTVIRTAGMNKRIDITPPCLPSACIATGSPERCRIRFNVNIVTRPPSQIAMLTT
jgi:hypothetical protein